MHHYRMELDESLTVAGRENYNRKVSSSLAGWRGAHGFSDTMAYLPELIPPALQPFQYPLDSPTSASPATYNTFPYSYQGTAVHMAPGYQVPINPGQEPNSNPMEFSALQSSIQSDQNSDTGGPITDAGWENRFHNSESELLDGSKDSTFNEPPVAPVALMYSDFQNQMLQPLDEPATHLPETGQATEPALALAAAGEGFTHSPRPTFLLGTTIMDLDPAAMAAHFYQEHSTIPSLTTFIMELRDQHQLIDAHHAKSLQVICGQKCINIDDIEGNGSWCWEAAMNMVEEAGGCAVVRVTMAPN